MRLHAAKLGLAGAILWALCLFIVTLLCTYTGYGLFWISQWMDLYPGFSISFGGAFVGLIYGFVDGFVCLYLLASLYNGLKP